MGNIVLLDDLTINKIAAGEVIERPANVVKELVENSIDAGAGKIVIEVKNGGKTFIKITDNGKGIRKDDMAISLERHATSKIRKVEDLEKTYTMGFRGEALASISAISTLTMQSKTKDEFTGTKLVAKAGNIIKAEECGMQVGTTISVENLFFNTPVRYKFLKQDITEYRYIKDWVELAFKSEENENTDHKYHISYDLWEMCEGVHLYSLASIYSAFASMLKIYDVLGKDVSDFENNRLKQEKVEKSKKEIEKLQLEIKKYINKYLYDEEKKSYVRNPEDKKMDISIIGAVTPFEVFKPKEKKVQNTIERINLSLRTYTGGYQRFENDNYMNGNPWPIANLWMTLYYLETGEKKKAKETFDFVIKTAGKHYFLGEQVDNETLKPNWVIGLGWSHAMFIIVLEKYMK